MHPSLVAVGVGALVFFALALVLLAWAGRIGKPGLDRARALPRGTHRIRTREEVLHDLKQGCLALDRAEAEARSFASRFARLSSDLEEARAQLAAAAEGVGHA